MNKRDRMMAQVEAVASQNGHVLRPWAKGRWGFNTGCRRCGAFVALTVSRGAQREGERLGEPCSPQEVKR